MFTGFHVLMVVGLVAGLWLGWTGGKIALGTFGGILGAAVGAWLGFLMGQMPLYFGIRLYGRRFASQTTEKLKESLIAGQAPPNLGLLELQRRGEDIRSYLPMLLDMLVAEDTSLRGFGLAALASAFPDLAKQINDYRITDSVESCRLKTAGLRRSIDAS
jgi:hypothetical protein